MAEDKLHTVNQVAILLKVHPLTVRRYIKEGKLKAVRIIGNIRIPQTSLDNFTQDIFPTFYGIKKEHQVLKDQGPLFTIYDPFLRLKGRGLSLKPLKF